MAGGGEERQGSCGQAGTGSSGSHRMGGEERGGLQPGKNGGGDVLAEEEGHGGGGQGQGWGFRGPLQQGSDEMAGSVAGLATHAEGVPRHQAEEREERDDPTTPAHWQDGPLPDQLQTV